MAAPMDPAGEIVTAERAWAWRLTSRYNNREWSTHAGDWTIYKGMGTAPENKMRQYRALRLFKLDGEGDRKLLHKNLLEAFMEVGNPFQRPDGLWEQNFSYTPDEPTSSHVSSAHGEEVEQQTPPHRRRRLTTVTGDAYIAAPVALPPPAAGETPEQSSGKPAPAPSSWFHETFMHDGSLRWSLGTGWDLSSGAVFTHFLIREYGADVDPDNDVDIAALPLPEARPSLTEDEVRKLAAAQSGRLVEVQYGADDGILRRTQEVDDVAAPPLDPSSNHIFHLYPDGMFSHVPGSMPRAGEGEGTVAFTWGGKMGELLKYQQVTAVFCRQSGAMLSLASFAAR